MNIIITSGATSEPIDSVRFITNFSTGKLASLVATSILHKIPEANIYYLHGKNAILPNAKTFNFEVSTVDSLYQKIESFKEEKIDAFIHLAAVSDYKLKDDNTNIKISSAKDELVLTLVPTIKIISKLRTFFPDATLVGAKLLNNVSEDELIEVATKLLEKNELDFCIANDKTNITNDTHKALIIDKNHKISYKNTKQEIADFLASLL